jgi:arsenical pump membrane protein
VPISNPANLVVFHTGMPPLGQWLASFGVPSLISIVSTYAIMRWIFRRQLRASIEHTIASEPLTGDGKLVLASLAAMVVVLLTASALKMDLGLPTCIAALIVTATVSIKSRINPLPLVRAISWSTLVLVAGLFILVDAIESTGFMRLTQSWLTWVQTLAPAYGALVVGFIVGLANNLVNNLPLGLIAGSVLATAHVKGLIANAVLIGVDLGPNFSVTGSLATILWLLALRKEKLNVTFWGFLQVGVIAMPFALFLSIGGAILMALLVHSS